MEQPEYISLPRAAKMLGLHRSTLSYWTTTKGALDFVYRGAKVFVKRQQIEEIRPYVLRRGTEFLAELAYSKTTA